MEILGNHGEDEIEGKDWRWFCENLSKTVNGWLFGLWRFRNFADGPDTFKKVFPKIQKILRVLALEHHLTEMISYIPKQVYQSIFFILLGKLYLQAIQYQLQIFPIYDPKQTFLYQNLLQLMNPAYHFSVFLFRLRKYLPYPKTIHQSTLLLNPGHNPF